MPNLRKIIDGKDPMYMEFATPKPPAGNDDLEQADPKGMAQHVAGHLTDPLEQTKEGFEGLTNAKLNYEMQKEKMRRQLLPVQSVIQHVNQLHQLQDQYGTHPVDPEVQNDANMGYQEERQGVPPNMQQTPGMMQQSRPDRNTAYPGAGPKIPTPPMGAQPAQQQSKGTAPKPKGAGQAFPKNGGKAGSNAAKKPGKGIEVHVKAATMAAPGASTPLRNTLASEKVRQMSSKCHMDAGGPGSGRKPGPASWQKGQGGQKRYPAAMQKVIDKRYGLYDRSSPKKVYPGKEGMDAGGTRTGGYFLKQPGVARTKRTRYGEEFEAEGAKMAHMPTPTMSRTVSAPARMSTTQTGGNVRTRLAAGGPGSGRKPGYGWHQRGENESKDDHIRRLLNNKYKDADSAQAAANILKNYGYSYRPNMTGPNTHELVHTKKLEAKAPPGWEGTVKHMKSHPEIDNPFALAWYEKNKGDTPHHG